MPQSGRRLSLPFDSPIWIKSLVQSPKLRKTVCNKYFKQFDANGNGQLEEQELSALCAAVCKAMHTLPVQDDDLHAALVKFDKSTSGGLTMSEFEKFFGHMLKLFLQQMEDPQHDTPADSAHPGNVTEAPDVFFFGEKVVFGQPPWASKQARVDNLSATSGDVVVVSIANVAGNRVWGPKDVDRTVSITSLQAVVADAAIGFASSIAVRLAHDESLLEATGTLASNGIDEKAAALTAIVTPASGLAAIALEALSACPEDPPDNGPRGDAHKTWLESENGMQLVCESLRVLLRVVTPEDEDARKLCLKCLNLPLPGTYGWDGRDELYPDELTFLAVQVLAKCSVRGDPAVKEVLLLWVERLCELQDTPVRPRRSSVDYVPQSTSEWTSGEVLKALPALVDVYDRDVLKALDSQATSILCSNVMLRDEYFGLDAWKIVACLRAFLGIVQQCSSSRVRSQPPKFLITAKEMAKDSYVVDFDSLVHIAAQEFGIVYTKIGGEHVDVDYEEGCEEYMYKRT